MSTAILYTKMAQETQVITSLKVYPHMAAAALKTGEARALALWTLARALDRQGSGIVSLDDLKAAAHSLGWAIGFRDHRFESALRQAKDAGMLREATSSGARFAGQRVLHVAGLEHVAYHYHLETLGAFPVEIPSSKFAKLADWRAALFASFHAGARSGNPKPISQKTLRAVTSVPERSQQRYNGRADVRVIQNIAVTTKDAKYNDNFYKLAEQHANVFTVRDKANNREVLAFSLPATYESTFNTARRGMARQVNKRLRALTGNVLVTGGEATRQRRLRLFWEPGKVITKRFDGTKTSRVETVEETARRAIMRHYDKKTGQAKPDAPRDLFVFDHFGARSRCGIWKAV